MSLRKIRDSITTVSTNVGDLIRTWKQIGMIIDVKDDKYIVEWYFPTMYRYKYDYPKDIIIAYRKNYEAYRINNYVDELYDNLDILDEKENP